MISFGSDISGQLGRGDSFQGPMGSGYKISKEKYIKMFTPTTGPDPEPFMPTKTGISPKVSPQYLTKDISAALGDPDPDPTHIPIPIADPHPTTSNFYDQPTTKISPISLPKIQPITPSPNPSNFDLQKNDLDPKKNIFPDNPEFSDSDLEKLRKYIEDLERKNRDFCDVEDNYKGLTKIVLTFFDNTKSILKQDLFGAWLGVGAKETPDRLYIKVMAKIDHVGFFFLCW